MISLKTLFKRLTKLYFLILSFLWKEGWKEMTSSKSTSTLFITFEIIFNFTALPFLFLTRQKEKQKNRSWRLQGRWLSTPFLPFILSLKMTKLTTFRQCHFFNALSFSSVSFADATNQEQVVTHLLMWKLALSSLFEQILSHELLESNKLKGT